MCSPVWQRRFVPRFLSLSPQVSALHSYIHRQGKSILKGLLFRTRTSVLSSLLPTPRMNRMNRLLPRLGGVVRHSTTVETRRLVPVDESCLNIKHGIVIFVNRDTGLQYPTYLKMSRSMYAYKE